MGQPSRQWIYISKHPKRLEWQALVPSCSFVSSFQALLEEAASLHLPCVWRMRLWQFPAAGPGRRRSRVQRSPGIRSHQERCGLKPANSYRPALLWFSSEKVFHALGLGFCWFWFCFLFVFCLLLFFFFLLGTNPMHQVLHDFMPPVPDFPETQPLGSCQTPAAGSWCCQNCPRGCSGVTSSKLGHEPYPVLGSSPEAEGTRRGWSPRHGLIAVLLGACRSRFLQ